MRIHLTADRYDAIHSYVFGADERVAFLFATRNGAAASPKVIDAWLPADHDYLERDRHGVELADHVRPQLIRIAHERGLAVIEVHAHNWPGPYTRFSFIDLDGLRDLGPHMTWRLPGRPYTALVLGPDSFDALQWHPSGAITSIEALEVDGEAYHPTGLSIGSLANPKHTGSAS